MKDASSKESRGGKEEHVAKDVSKVLFNPFSWYGALDGGMTEQEVTTKDANRQLQVLIKQTFKKDEQTRVKALKKLTEMGQSESVDGDFLDCLASHFSSIYSNLSEDSSPNIRYHVHQLLHLLIQKNKKHLSKSIKATIGYWLSSVFEADKLVSQLAQDCFKLAFDTEERKRRLFEVTKKDIGNYLDAALNERFIRSCPAEKDSDELNVFVRKIYTRLMIIYYFLDARSGDILDREMLDSLFRRQFILSLLDLDSALIKRSLYLLLSKAISILSGPEDWTRAVLMYVFTKESSRLVSVEAINFLNSSIQCCSAVWKESSVSGQFWKWFDQKCNGLLIEALPQFVRLLIALPSEIGMANATNVDKVFGNLFKFSGEVFHNREHEFFANGLIDCWNLMFEKYTDTIDSKIRLNTYLIDIFHHLAVENAYPQLAFGIYLQRLLSYYSPSILKAYYTRDPEIYPQIVGSFFERIVMPVLCNPVVLEKPVFSYIMDSLIHVFTFDPKRVTLHMVDVLSSWVGFPPSILQHVEKLFVTLEEDSFENYDLIINLLQSCIEGADPLVHHASLARIVFFLASKEQKEITIVLTDINIDQLNLNDLVLVINDLFELGKNGGPALPFVIFTFYIYPALEKLLDEDGDGAQLFTLLSNCLEIYKGQCAGMLYQVFRSYVERIASDSDATYSFSIIEAFLTVDKDVPFLAMHDHELCLLFLLLLVREHSYDSSNNELLVDLINSYIHNLNLTSENTQKMGYSLLNYCLKRLEHEKDEAIALANSCFRMLSYLLDDRVTIFHQEKVSATIAALVLTCQRFNYVLLENTIIYIGEETEQLCDKYALHLLKEKNSLSMAKDNNDIHDQKQEVCYGIFSAALLVFFIEDFNICDNLDVLNDHPKVLLVLEQFYEFLLTVQKTTLIFHYTNIWNKVSLVLAHFWRRLKEDTTTIDVTRPLTHIIEPQDIPDVFGSIALDYAEQHVPLSLVFKLIQSCVLENNFSILDRLVTQTRLTNLTLDAKKYEVFLIGLIKSVHEYGVELFHSVIRLISIFSIHSPKKGEKNDLDLTTLFSHITSRIIDSSNCYQTCCLLTLYQSLFVLSESHEDLDIDHAGLLLQLLDVISHKINHSQSHPPSCLLFLLSKLAHVGFIVITATQELSKPVLIEALFSSLKAIAKMVQIKSLDFNKNTNVLLRLVIFHIHRLYSLQPVAECDLLLFIVENFLSEPENTSWISTCKAIHLINNLPLDALVAQKALIDNIFMVQCRFDPSFWEGLIEYHIKWSSDKRSKDSQSIILSQIVKLMDVDHSYDLALHLLAWRVFVESRKANKTDLVAMDILCCLIKEDRLTKLESFMSTFLVIFKDVRAMEPLRMFDWSQFDHYKMNVGCPVLALQLLWLYIYYHLLEFFPSILSSWWKHCQQRQLSMNIEKITREYFSPDGIYRQLSLIHSADVKEMAPMKFKVLKAHHDVSIQATIPIEEAKLEMVIHIPPNYPLEPLKIHGGSRIGVSETTWRKWLFSSQALLTSQNGNLLDGLLLWKKNSLKRFEGIEECAICYSILQPVDLSLPSQLCKTCKHKFHGACLYKWFKSSGNATCPLCRSLI